MLVVAANSSECYSVARNTFNFTYSKANFFINGPLSGEIYEYKKQTVRIGSVEWAEKIFKIFGDLIQFIDISFKEINDTSIKEIIGFINDNCTESLKQLHLKNSSSIILNGFKKPFPKVEKATFLSLSNVQSKIDIKLDQMLPRLKRLELEIVNNSDWELIGDNFPNLRTLIIQLPEPSDSVYPDIGRLFEGSKNINSLRINYITLKVLKTASNYLTNLKVLVVSKDILNEPYDGDQIHFSSVSVLDLVLKDTNSQAPGKLTFTKLNKLFLSVDGDGWIEFFKNQQKNPIFICQLNFDDLTNQQLVAIAGSQPNSKLTVINAGKATNLSVNAIINFIEKSKIFFLNFYGAPINVADRKTLEEKLSLSWTINGGELLKLLLRNIF